MKFLYILLALMLMSCSNDAVIYKQTVTITSPSGVQRKHTVYSNNKPFIIEHFSGVTHISYPKIKNILVPSGWYYEIQVSE